MFTRLVDLRVLERKNSDLSKLVDLSAAGEKIIYHSYYLGERNRKHDFGTQLIL